MTHKANVAPETLRTVQDRLRGLRPRVAIVLGSGLGGLGKVLPNPMIIPYREIPGFPTPKVPGHGAELIAGELEGVPVILQSGRFHFYEGHDHETVVRPVRLFRELGTEVLIVTNAAGGLRMTLVPPTLMLIADHINLMWRSPLVGSVARGEERFPDLSEPYDRGLARLAREVALREGIALDEGVYVAVLGPSYETPAEIRMLQWMRADAVGMSTVPEVIAARAGGMRVLGISSITNFGAGLTAARLDHREVLDAGERVAEDLTRLVRGVLGAL